MVSCGCELAIPCGKCVKTLVVCVPRRVVVCIAGSFNPIRELVECLATVTDEFVFFAGAIYLPEHAATCYVNVTIFAEFGPQEFFP